MFERFTDRARRVLVLAQEEARLLGHNFIGTEHLLLGLLGEGDGLAAQALESLDIRAGEVREKVEETIGPAGTATGSPPFTPRANKVLELSLREALQLGHNYIGTEHILLGLVREGEGVGAEVLERLGANLPSVRLAVMQLLDGYQPDEHDLPSAQQDRPIPWRRGSETRARSGRRRSFNSTQRLVLVAALAAGLDVLGHNLIALGGRPADGAYFGDAPLTEQGPGQGLADWAQLLIWVGLIAVWSVVALWLLRRPGHRND